MPYCQWSGDEGADPNQLVVIIDKLSATSASAAAGETFSKNEGMKKWGISESKKEMCLSSVEGR
jgi:hypothetical protein